MNTAVKDGIYNFKIKTPPDVNEGQLRADEAVLKMMQLKRWEYFCRDVKLINSFLNFAGKLTGTCDCRCITYPAYPVATVAEASAPLHSQISLSEAAVCARLQARLNL